METDAQLEQHLHQLAMGEESALAALYAALSTKVYTIALRILESKEEAQEVLQDTFLQLYRKAGHYQSQLESVTAFTCGVARNLAISRLRARRVRPERADEYDVHDPLSALSVATEHNPTDQLMLEQALGSLHTDERQLLHASFFDGYTHQELSERFALPLGSLKSKLRRSLLKLRTVMERS